VIFTVVFSQEAENDLALIWLSADDRNDITTAAGVVDSLLRTDAHVKGRIRNAESSERSLDVTPLQIAFHVSVKDRLVTILHVRHMGSD